MAGAFISEIDVKEFRGIKRCKEPIKLSKFNVLIGKNNSGKSSLLEALYLFPLPRLHSTIYGGDSDRINQIGERHSGTDSLVYGYSGNAEMKCNVNEYPFTVEIMSNGTSNSSVNDEEVAISNLQHVSKILKISERNIEDISIYIPNDTKTLDRYAEYVSSLENEIVKSGANKRVAEFVNQCIDEKYTEVLWTREGLSCRKERPDGSPLYIKLDDLGDGIKRATIIMLLLEAHSPRVVLWDDFESASHPTLIRAQLEWLSKKDWQVVLATHSIDVLYQLLELEISPADIQILQMKKLKDDTLIHESLAIDELEDLMNANADPRLLVGALGI
ncbi:MAG: AAA family ATPase [Methanosarcinales archaeon]|nr:AAA family ATPase [Methanosarcinales archaeon]